MANVRWSAEKNIQFINEYQRNECLWDPKHPQYKNLNARQAAYKLIMEAHQQHRRADAHLKCNRFEEAIQCHHNAAEFLLEAMKTTTSPVALESLTLQHTYHLKQNDFIKNKKEHFTKMKKAIDNMKCLQLEQGANV